MIPAQDWLANRASATPERLAIITPTQQITYKTLNSQVRQTLIQWQSKGICAGDTVAILPQNDLQTVVNIWAIVTLGATLLPINTRLTRAEIDFQLQLAQCQWLIQNNDIQQYTAKIEQVITPSVTTHRLAILFTSGTSGTPKAAILSPKSFFYSALASAYHAGTLPSDRWLCVLPLYHVGGLSILFRCCLYGATVALMPSFDAHLVNQQLAQQPIKLVSLVPTMLYRMLELNPSPATFQSLRLILLGGAAPSDELIEQALSYDLPVAMTYGLTEACSQVATALPSTIAQKGATVGHPLPFMNVSIMNEQGVLLPAGQAGEITVSSPALMEGYLNDPQATEKAIRNGNLYTGDMGYLDEDGDLWVLQRRSDLIISGGENIYPTEIEQVLTTHPTIKEACVVGIPHPEWGQQVAAMIVCTKQVTIEQIQTFCSDKLARYKLPRKIVVVPELPLTASGKVARKTIAEMLITHETDN